MMRPAKTFSHSTFQNSLRLKRRLKRQQGFIQMTNMLRREAALWASLAMLSLTTMFTVVTTIFMVVTPTFSQAPTDAQRSAIRSECRSDYEAHCASIPPGGAASLQCLQKNMSSLSPGCQTAVRAVEAPAAPKAESAPAAAPAKPAAETAAPAAAPKAAASGAAKKPSSAQIAAVRSACRSDYQKVCAGVPTGGAPALQCLEKNKAKVSPSCEKAVTAASGGGAAPAAGGAPAEAAGRPTRGDAPPPAPAPPPGVGGRARPRPPRAFPSPAPLFPASSPSPLRRHP